MKKSSLTFLALCGLLTAARPAALAVQIGEVPSTATDSATGISKSKLAPPYSGNVGEVVKLAQSGVDESVVLAYVRNSPVPFNASADEIIKLHDAGISAQVLTAMLQRGGELRQQAPPVPNYGAAPQALPVAPQESIATYSAPAYYGAQEAAPASTVVYLNSTPSYTYPYNYSYGYSWYYPYSYSLYYPWWGYASWCYPWGRSGWCYPSYSSYYQNSHYDHSYNHGHNSTWSHYPNNPRVPGNVYAGGRVGSRFNYVRPGGIAGSSGFNGGTRVGSAPRMGGTRSMGGGARFTGGTGGMRTISGGSQVRGSFGGGMRVASGGGGGARFGGGGHVGGGFGRR